MALLEVHGLVKWYGPRRVVDGVSFDVNPGEVVGLLGPNGAGKTTSFRMATGQVTPNAGEVWFDGKEVTRLPMYRRARLGMGYLSQEPSIFRKLSVEKNVLAILEALPRSRTLGRKLTRAERRERTDAALARFKLDAVRHNPAARCSGGEKRRLEIARCLVCEPLLILLDEPLAAVDPLTKEDIRRNIRDLANQGIGILLTDHDVREVMKIADRAYVIIDGKVVATGTPEQLKRDRMAVEGYLGSTFADEVALKEMYGDVPRQYPPAAAPEFPRPAPPSLAVLDLPENEGPEDDPPPPPNGGMPREGTISERPGLPRPDVTSPLQSPAGASPAPRNEDARNEAVPDEPVREEAPPAEPEPEPLDLPPVPPPQPRPIPSTPLWGPPAPGQFSGLAQQVIEAEKMRRLVEMLAGEHTWAGAWHDLNLRGLEAVPVLLEALERRDPQIRHLSFRLLEQITGEPLRFDANAPDDVRLRQVAHLRAKLDRRPAA
jgi:lipopolysaccharide export system ATP-binding protein